MTHFTLLSFKHSIVRSTNRSRERHRVAGPVINKVASPGEPRLSNEPPPLCTLTSWEEGRGGMQQRRKQNQSGRIYHWHHSYVYELPVYWLPPIDCEVCALSQHALQSCSPRSTVGELCAHHLEIHLFSVLWTGWNVSLQSIPSYLLNRNKLYSHWVIV